MRRAAEKEDPEAAAADQKYLDWLEDEWQGHERGNPPKSRELDEQVALAAQYFPEPEEKDHVTVLPYEPGDDWTFGEWAAAHGYSQGEVELTSDLEADRESRLAQREGQQMVDEIQRIADDPQYADVRDQIEEISGYVSRVMELGDQEPGELWASGEI